MKSKKILIINQNQFGYNIATYYYCKYLRKDFDITYICWDYGCRKIDLEGVTVLYISRAGGLVTRNLRFISHVLKEIRINSYSLHILKHFRGCSILKLFCPHKKFLLDIRTGTIDKKRIKRFVYDIVLKSETFFFKHISIISKTLALKLGLEEKAYILPLGADIISHSNKAFDDLNLLYVGTLSHRNIDQAIKGFSLFYKENKKKIKMGFTIVGGGYDDEEQQLKELIMKENLTESVHITGPIPHEELQSFFHSHNIGIGYIPMTDFFDAQPSTKIFEYLLSGMAVIGTATTENKFIIDNRCGVLIEDTPDDFYHGLSLIMDKKNAYNSKIIRLTAMPYTWEKIIREFKQKILKILS